jgi:8-oxo-dGTP diphosphatase
MTEQEYLDNYDAKQFDAPLMTVDSVLLTIKDDQLCVLLAKRADHPCKDQWGLAGGFIDMAKDLSNEDCAKRKLVEKTGVVPPYLNQLATFSSPDRDPRGWSVSVVYYALMAYQDSEALVEATSGVEWVDVNGLDFHSHNMAFDHLAIITKALAQLKEDAMRTLIAAHALPEQFTLVALQKVHEIILDCTILQKSFRRRIEKADVLEDTGELSKGAGRPSALFKVKPELDAYSFRCSLDL